VLEAVVLRAVSTRRALGTASTTKVPRIHPLGERRPAAVVVPAVIVAVSKGASSSGNASVRAITVKMGRALGAAGSTGPGTVGRRAALAEVMCGHGLTPSERAPRVTA
jgi:hypothetical protein